ncbi:anthranilate synthase component I family protein [Robertkochia marina]|uniref:Anthranilate synthase component 1 n=1 Tax=Robertkochia marina TaxID=1227945 RepID=A0A4S3M069_9FLAO|nr:anthranilate synthase component I family protein [Robertkochia marina]THD66397.1 anthranilate synthase component I family protein [Robertkochia marina]TRZ44076.1 anthranilate synthase component I family protein [Robertkochia marina]
MNSYRLKTSYRKILADTITPVSIYLKIRDRFPNSILLESSDYHANDNSFSYICFNPIAHIKAENNTFYASYPDGTQHEAALNRKDVQLPQLIEDFAGKFETDGNEFKFINNGLFGYIAYDAVRYFEDIEIRKKDDRIDIPDLYYAVYRNIIAINHFKNEAYLFSHDYKDQNNLEEIQQLIRSRNYASYSFQPEGSPASALTDDDYKELVKKAKHHCSRGDVFQLVLSRRFSQKFKGDEFNVYRALRSVNPSPYLFFFDYGNFRIFGSSPESQLVIKNDRAEIHPIAGTFKRTGNDEQDARLARALSNDEKENSEHVMLVDLARNDLSRNGNTVEVETNREVQFFSHVIHLVSKVVAKKNPEIPTMQVVADTFPAGTLSGAPKHMAMQLIDRYEPGNRNYYGGAIGFMDFSGNFNHAIMIRTFLSKDHELYYQAGAGLVAASDPEAELQETYNKLGALTSALELAKEI